MDKDASAAGPLGSGAATSGALFLDAEELYKELLRGVQMLCQADTKLVGITSGGAWLVERLQRDLNLPGKPGDE